MGPNPILIGVIIRRGNWAETFTEGKHRDKIAIYKPRREPWKKTNLLNIDLRLLDSNESACSVGDLGSIPRAGKSLEKGMTIHSSILAWNITQTEESGGLQSMGSPRVGHDWAANTQSPELKRINFWVFFLSLFFFKPVYSTLIWQQLAGYYTSLLINEMVMKIIYLIRDIRQNDILLPIFISLPIETNLYSRHG